MGQAGPRGILTLFCCRLLVWHRARPAHRQARWLCLRGPVLHLPPKAWSLCASIPNSEVSSNSDLNPRTIQNPDSPQMFPPLGPGGQCGDPLYTRALSLWVSWPPAPGQTPGSDYYHSSCLSRIGGSTDPPGDNVGAKKVHQVTSELGATVWGRV